jgi:hypothetical protein
MNVQGPPFAKKQLPAASWCCRLATRPVMSRNGADGGGNMARQRDNNDDEDRMTIKASVPAGLPSGTMLPGMDTWWSTMAEGQREFMHFMTDRISKDGEAVQELISSRNWSEAMTVQTRWLQEMMRDYLDETRKMASLYSRQATEAVQSQRARP